MRHKIPEDIDWRIYAEIAFILLRWSPRDFWAATPVDFWIAYGGWRKRNGLDVSEIKPLGRDELDQLMKILY